MNNPFPALITYMLIQTVSLYPVASFVLLGLIMLVGWGMALNELFNLKVIGSDVHADSSLTRNHWG